MSARIGILGGTFNPVHRGHLRMALRARARFKLDRVLLMPCARPPHKPAGGLASAADRLAMLRRAVRGRRGLAVSDLEIRRGGISYTIDTIRALQRRHPDARWYFIIGSDSLPELHAWRCIDELLQRCVFITVARPGFPLSHLTPHRLRLKSPWPKVLAQTVIRDPGLDISSTEIRRRAASGESLRGLVPPAVSAYILKRNLYRAKENRRSKR